MSDEMAQKINKKHGASINFEQIANYEGGQALRGYVPWWPIIKSISKNGAITVLLNFHNLQTNHLMVFLNVALMF